MAPEVWLLDVSIDDVIPFDCPIDEQEAGTD